MDIPDDKPLFVLKKWNAVAMWSWDVHNDTCAICRVNVSGNVYYRSIYFFVRDSVGWLADVFL